MSSSSNSTMISSCSHGWDQQHPSLSSIITSSTPLSPPFLSSASSRPSSSSSSSSSSSAMSDPVSQLATPGLQINKISVQLVANLDKATSSASDASCKGHNAESSLSIGSDFEFHSSYLPEINEDLPASPKLIRLPTAANYWGGLSNNGRLEMIIPQQAQISNPLLSSPSYTPVIKQISAPSSPSVSHLKTDDYKDYFLSSSSVPQTPNNSQQKQGGQLPSKQRPREDNTWGINSNDHIRRKSSILLDRRALDLSPLVMQKDVSLAGGFEHKSIVSPSSSSSSSPNGSSPSSSSPNGSSPANINEEFDDEHKYTTSIDPAAATINTNYNKKHRSRDSTKKCTFKDFLGWNVNPSSIIRAAADPPHHHDHSCCKYESTSFESPRRQSTSSSISSPKPHYLLSGLRKTAPKSPAATSPLRSPAAAAVTVPTLAHGRPSPTRSPQRPPPMSPHALHYKQQKARSDELRKKTFLPYRQSLLGCLGGATMSHSRALQQVW